MSHDHHHHIELSDESGGEGRLFVAMLLTGGFMLAELIGGLLTGSLALLADAGHMLGDFVALVLAWMALRLGKRSPDLRRSFGYHRFQVLAAFVNGLSLFVLAAWISLEACQRLLAPNEIIAGPMLAIAILGLVINLVVFKVLTGGGASNINMRAAALHVLGDLLGSIAAIVAAIVILSSGWLPADPLLSILVAILIMRGAYSIVAQSGHILLEGTPEEVDPKQVTSQLTREIPELQDVHHVHIWSLTDERPVLTLHARVDEGIDHDQIMHRIHRALEQSFGVSHATVQLEYGPCTDQHKHVDEA